ncbi:tRNA nucleotidyltransferase/poly(A) polymerase [Rubripirellula tenax]|uniref:tRNA nucleotidyltransferase/poly(A) polymerase n=1 Tax=Rubripirellula tenax TaxID=2528015 RepID=A0A5C6FH25_9BACT|nr:CCA tRNA nucleotidyltransferase [Rubripirellula tenax]TWU60821.1 tRNA nucleotidyltransferase/poly(A) polymerase [Rubripirellula tenax]
MTIVIRSRPNLSPKATLITAAQTAFFRGPESAEALRIIDCLRQSGFEAVLAGGCVRDALLGKQPKDYDVATNATPDAVRQVFGKRSTLAFGASFGVIGVLPPRGDRSPDETVQPTEVATFRSDGEYSDGRRPDSVHYGNAEQDALRRDFTINGLFYDPISDQVIDYVNGVKDLQAGLLRTIGNPHLRFGEDKLRLLRAVRFTTTLGFKIDPTTRQAIRLHARDLPLVSGERIGAEMRRVFTAPSFVDGLRHLIDCHLDEVVLPELVSVDLDSLKTTSDHLARRDFPIVMACFLIHADAPEHALQSITQRWKLSNEEVRRVTAAITHHETVIHADRLAWSTVQPCLTDRDADVIIEVATAITHQRGHDVNGLSIARKALTLPADELNPPPLLTGDVLRSLGIPAGPQYKAILQAVRDAQLDGTIRTRDEAIAMARIDKPGSTS